MSITRAILKKADNLYMEAIKPDTKHSNVKAFTSGLIEGAIDGAILAYPILMVSCIYWKNQALKK